MFRIRTVFPSTAAISLSCCMLLTANALMTVLTFVKTNPARYCACQSESRETQKVFCQSFLSKRLSRACLGKGSSGWLEKRVAKVEGRSAFPCLHSFSPGLSQLQPPSDTPSGNTLAAQPAHHKPHGHTRTRVRFRQLCKCVQQVVRSQQRGDFSSMLVLWRQQDSDRGGQASSSVLHPTKDLLEI